MYVKRKEKIKIQTKDKRLKVIMLGYYDNHTRDTLKLYNPYTKRFVMIRDIKWAERKTTDPE